MIGELYLILNREVLAFSFIESALKRGVGWRDVSYSPFFMELGGDEDFKEMIERAENQMN